MEDKKNYYTDNDYCDNRLEEVKKPYTQFSKRIIAFCFVNLLAVEIFVMVMVVLTRDTSVLPYFITSIVVQMLGAIIWYLKNSEAEKKARISAEVERMKLGGVPKESFDKILSDITDKVEEYEPDTYYKGNEGTPNIVTPVDNFESFG